MGAFVHAPGGGIRGPNKKRKEDNAPCLLTIHALPIQTSRYACANTYTLKITNEIWAWGYSRARQTHSHIHKLTHSHTTSKLKVYDIFYQPERAKMREVLGGYSRHVFLKVGKLLLVRC